MYPNPNSGSFTVQGEKEGEYYLMDEAGKLILSFTLSADNKFTKTINGLGDGFYIVVGQNKYGVTKQRILVTK
ncbi:MAG: T9SS type A sorting domain-containing protein [Bacteroidia bacterium]|nr:T9SS type A sorting domain-containing protein [Bacteroidia bacterium]